jgi:hypothetical protein
MSRRLLETVAPRATAAHDFLMVNPEWRLLWSDEFDGPSGAPVDARYWNHEVGAGGWGNGERQRYTDGALNAVLDGNGGGRRRFERLIHAHARAPFRASSMSQ